MIGIMTINSHVYNYGGFLQEMALQDILDTLGYENEIINYSPNNEILVFSMKHGIRYLSFRKIIGKFRDKYNTNKLADNILHDIDCRKKAFDRYRERNLRLSCRYDFDSLHMRKLPYDTLICGSDQIWNPDYCIPAFFLNFADNQTTIAYAASIGKEKLTCLQKKRYAELLNNLDCISVREKSAIKIIENIINKKVNLVLDPTLLCSKTYWLEKAHDSTKDYKNYIFCYFLEITSEKIKIAKDLSEKYGYKLVVIPYLHGVNESLFGDIRDADVTPGDFLKLILNANLVLTDSFHASVFSIIFEKQFYVFSRCSNGYSMNTRLETLLDYVEAGDLMVNPQNIDVNMITKKCEYNMSKLYEMREKSLLYINESINKNKMKEEK